MKPFLYTLTLAVFLFHCSSHRKEAFERSVSIFSGGRISAGSGVLVARGRAVTCLHVVRIGLLNLSVHFAGKEYPALLVRQSEKFDLALLSFDAPFDPPEISWAAREDLKPGEEVFLTGSPYGLDDSLLAGSISNIDRKGSDRAFPEIPFIQTQGMSFPGTSGAGVYLSDGRLIGINRSTFGLAPGTGIGLVIPSGFVRQFLGETYE